MDALLAYDSPESEDETGDINSSSVASKKSIKKSEQETKSSSQQTVEVEISPEAIEGSNDHLSTQQRSKYSYSQFNSSLISYNDHHSWIPSNLLPKTNLNNSISTQEDLQFGPQRKEESERNCDSYNYNVPQKSAVGPVRCKEDPKTSFKPYFSKQERENVACNASQTTKDGIYHANALVGNAYRTSYESSKKIGDTNSKKATFKPTPYVPKREREKLQNTNLASTEKSLSIMTCSNKQQLENAIVEVNSTTLAVSNDKQYDLANESKVTNKPPKRVLYRINGHLKCVNHVRWNPVKHNILASASMDSTIALWDTANNGSCLSRLSAHQAAVKDVKWASCGSQLLSCGFDKCAKLIDVETGKVVCNFPHREFVTCVQYHPTDGNLFLAGTSRNGIYCWDTRIQKVVSEFQAPFGQVQDIAFLPGGEEFISAAEVLRRNSTDKGIMVWDFRTTAIMSNQIYQEAFTCTCIKVHPGGTFFGAQSNADYIALFSTKRPYKLNKYKRYEGHQVSAYVVGFDFSPDGSITISGSADGNMYIYNSDTSRLISTIPAHTSVCMDACYNPSMPSTVATCSFDGQIALLV